MASGEKAGRAVGPRLRCGECGGYVLLGDALGLGDERLLGCPQCGHVQTWRVGRRVARRV